MRAAKPRLKRSTTQASLVGSLQALGGGAKSRDSWNAWLPYPAPEAVDADTDAAMLRAVWRLDFDPGTNSVEVHMSRLRAKLDRGGARPLLRTVKGRGYMLDAGVGVGADRGSGA